MTEQLPTENQTLLEYAYCTNCKAVKKYIREPMLEDHRNKHAAEDILCPECFSIICTFHASDGQ